jgi:hypothetical protein
MKHQDAPVKKIRADIPIRDIKISRSDAADLFMRIL